MRDAEPPVRYTSYHSDKTFSILDVSRERVRDKSCFSFEYNGMYYSMESLSSKSVKKWEVFTCGPMYKYLMPWSGGEGECEFLAEFHGDTFDEFIETFEIEGKTVRWVLEHQKCWKYKLTAEHFERVLTGFSFEFVYRGVLCNVTSAGMLCIKNARSGRYLRVVTGALYDVSQYAPLVPGTDYWFDHFGLVENAKTPVIWIGPFETDGELLDETGFGDKTLREIFDTEYDDGAVLCGMFDG